MDCSNPELLAALAEGRLDPAERDALLDHAAGCDDCREALLILCAPMPATASRPARTAARTWIPWAAAAVFALSVGALLFLGRGNDDPNTAALPKTPAPLPKPEPREAPKPPVAPRDLPKPQETPKTEPQPLKPEVPKVRTPELPATPIKPAPQPEPAPAPKPTTPEPPKPVTISVVAVVDRVDGDVVVLNGQAQTPAKPGTEIRQGEGLEVRGPRSGALLSYPDKTRLELEGDTRIREFLARDPAKGLRLFVERGAVKAEVSKQPAGQAMVFDTPHGEARVIGTTLRISVEADPRKGTRLEVEEGKVELKNALGKTVMVEAGHYAVAAAGLAPSAKRLPKEEVLLSFDFEDGKKPAMFSKGTVQLGPDRRACLALDSAGTGNSQVHIADENLGFFTFSGDEVLSFDYWVDAQAGSVNFQFWNSTQKVAHEMEVPKLVFGKWAHVSVRAAEVGDPAKPPKPGDLLSTLYIQATGSPGRKFFLDNLVVTRTRSLKPRPVETK